MSYKAVALSPSDNVATALEDIPADSTAAVRRGGEILNILVLQTIPFGHKLALQALHAGETVIKYGQAIGLATQDIGAGCHVHVHNLESLRGRGDKREADRI